MHKYIGLVILIIFSSIAKLTPIQLFLSMVGPQDSQLHQFNIKNDFLNVDLQEEVHMEQPPRLLLVWIAKNPTSLALERFSMKKGLSDCFVFYRGSRDDINTLTIYVHDIIITENDVLVF